MKSQDERLERGRPTEGVILPIAPNKSDMPVFYTDLKEGIIQQVKKTRFRVIHKVNEEKNLLYWYIGNEIIQRQHEEGWGTRVIDRLSADLKEEFPDMRGFSTRNLKYMRKFAEYWNDFSIVQQSVAQLQWRSLIHIFEKVTNQTEALWYIQKALESGWSSNVLALMIDSNLVAREGKSISNFCATLPPLESDMAIQSFKDPYIFDFVGTADRRTELEVEQSLISHMEKFLLELGQGFAFVGRQVHLEVGGDDFYIDLLFYHLKLRCFVVIELKNRDFRPGDVGQLTMYQNIVNKVLKHEDDKPTIGLLLVKGKNKTVVEYSLMGYENPIGVSDWKDQLEKSLPEKIMTSLPSIEEIEREIEVASQSVKMDGELSDKN